MRLFTQSKNTLLLESNDINHMSLENFTTLIAMTKIKSEHEFNFNNRLTTISLQKRLQSFQPLFFIPSTSCCTVFDTIYKISWRNVDSKFARVFDSEFHQLDKKSSTLSIQIRSDQPFVLDCHHFHFHVYSTGLTSVLEESQFSIWKQECISTLVTKYIWRFLHLLSLPVLHIFLFYHFIESRIAFASTIVLELCLHTCSFRNNLSQKILLDAQTTNENNQRTFPLQLNQQPVKLRAS